MADEIRSFSLAIPPRTQPDTPVTFDVSFPPRIVAGLTVVLPDGLNGTVGIALGMAGQALIPRNAGEWIIGSGEVINWAVDNLPDSGAWQLYAYNVGSWTHTVQLRFALNIIRPQSSGATGPQLASAVALSSTDVSG